MAEQPSQRYASHRRLVPGYHIVTGSLLVGNFVFAVAHLWLHRTYGAVAGLGVAVALLLMFHYARQFPKKVQDRVIRLEEQLRYQRLLPPDLQTRAGQLTLRQIIGLRFAGDDELAGLVRRALDEGLSEEQIKKDVKNWKGDYLRA